MVFVAVATLERTHALKSDSTGRKRFSYSICLAKSKDSRGCIVEEVEAKADASSHRKPRPSTIAQSE